MITVLVVDDQEIVRRGLAMILGVEPDIQVVGEASDGAEAVALVERLDPDIVLLDVQMPTMDGLEALRAMRKAGFRSGVVVLTTFERNEYIFEALRSGCAGFLLKNGSPEELVESVRRVAAGEALLSSSVTKRVIDEFARTAPATGRRPEPVEELTGREAEVLALVAEGLSNAEIAESLFVGEATVKSHVSNVLAKLRLRDRVQAAVYYHRHPPPPTRATSGDGESSQQ